MVEKIRRIFDMNENLDPEIDDLEESEWKDHAVEIGRNFFSIFGVIALIRDVVRFVCRK